MLQLLSILFGMMLYLPSVQANPCPGSISVCDNTIVSDAICKYEERTSNPLFGSDYVTPGISCSLSEFEIDVFIELPDDGSTSASEITERTMNNLKSRCIVTSTQCKKKYNCKAVGVCR